MQIKLKIALVAAAFALVSFPAFAVDMPPDGTKNFNAPSDAPSYFSDETVPESARVNHQATFEQPRGAGPRQRRRVGSGDGNETVRTRHDL